MIRYGLCTLLNACALGYGAVIDLKRREIPDLVPITLAVTGLFLRWDTFLPRLGVMILTGAAVMYCSKLSNTDPPGGDFKLLTTMAFSCELGIFLSTLFLIGVGVILVSILKRQFKRSIPLCTYAAPAYLLAGAVPLLL